MAAPKGHPNYNPGKGAKNPSLRQIRRAKSSGVETIGKTRDELEADLSAGSGAAPAEPPTLLDVVKVEQARLSEKYPGFVASETSTRNIARNIVDYGTPISPGNRSPPELSVYGAYSGPKPGDRLAELRSGTVLGAKAAELDLERRRAAGIPPGAHEAPPGFVTTGLGLGLPGEQRAYTRASARIDPLSGERVAFGGGMAGERIPGEAVYAAGANALFNRRSVRSAEASVGRSLSSDFSGFKGAADKVGIDKVLEFREGSTLTVTETPSSPLSREQEAQLWRDFGVYDRQSESSKALSLLYLGGGSNPVLPSVVLNRDSYIAGQKKIYDSSVPVMLRGSVEGAVGKSFRPRISGFGLDIPGVSVPEGWTLPGEIQDSVHLPKTYLFTDESTIVESLTKQPESSLGSYAQAGYAGGSFLGVAGAAAGPAGVAAGFAVGAAGGVAYKFVSDFVKPKYSAFVDYVAPNSEVGAALLTPGPPGVNLVMYGSLKFADDTQAKYSGVKRFEKPSDVAGEVAGLTSGLVASMVTVGGLSKYIPQPKGDYVQLRYREVNMEGVKFEGGKTWRGLVFEKGDNSKVIFGMSGRKPTFYGGEPKVMLDYSRTGAALSGRFVSGSGSRVGQPYSPFDSRYLTNSASSPGDELAYLSSSRDLMRGTKYQSVPGKYLKELDLGNVKSIPKEYAPTLNRLIVGEKDYVIFGGAARESQVLNPKSTSDIDLYLKSGSAADKAKFYVGELSKVAGPPVRVSPTSPNLIEVKVGSGWRHMVDIHDVGGSEIQAGVRLDSEYFGWGNKIRYPEVKIGDKVFRQLSEEGLALGSGSTIPRGMQQPFNPTETKFVDRVLVDYTGARGVFEPAGHRLKDVLNFQRVQGSLVSYGGETGSSSTAKDLGSLEAFKKASDIKFAGVVDDAGLAYSGSGWYLASGSMMPSLSVGLGGSSVVPAVASVLAGGVSTFSSSSSSSLGRGSYAIPSVSSRSSFVVNEISSFTKSVSPSSRSVVSGSRSVSSSVLRSVSSSRVPSLSSSGGSGSGSGSPSITSRSPSITSRSPSITSRSPSVSASSIASSLSSGSSSPSLSSSLMSGSGSGGSSWRSGSFSGGGGGWLPGGGSGRRSSILSGNKFTLKNPWRSAEEFGDVVLGSGKKKRRRKR